MKRPTLDAVLEARARKRSLALVTNIKTGAQSLVTNTEVSGDLTLDGAALAAAREALRHDRSGTLKAVDGALFVHVFNPPLRLIIVGAVHIAQALAPIAALAGYDVTIVDPRGAFATEARFPGVALTEEWPDDAMKRLAPDSRTAVVTLTHDPKLDDPALHVALRSEAFYIGSLGSKKTHASRQARLAEAGFTPAEMARIHGPIGLKLGGRAPAEIAIAIMAQVIQALHAAPGDEAAAAA
ncbi:MAG TPA: XdhC family protein [Alphaproteobacteria bacterium]|jgi:xanthine dehydrogenase accessory factor|nr:XdhC family protein [Alphaproteobacteria bacterium]